MRRGATWQANAPYDPALVGVTGITGWILPLLLIGALAAAKRLPVPDAPDEDLHSPPALSVDLPLG